MTPSRPYVLRAIYEWILANELTPHLLVNALHDDVQVPLDYVKDGQIILNIAPSAVQTLSLGNDYVMFNARFRGIPTEVSVPVLAVLGVYARENGQGMMFDDSSSPPSPEGGPPTKGDSPPTKGSSSASGSQRPKGRPSLKVVK